ncbi:MAG: hypothetical protein FD137_2094 [Spirochaetes bacterium]|nr:MAG: hypothetical protein FD137_2094 [Spirochaetota bacterium]
MEIFRLGSARRQGFGAALFCIYMVLCILPGFAKSWEPGAGVGGPSLPPLQERFPFFAIPLSQSVCAGVLGGDVRMELDANGSRLKVSVIDNEYEARLNRYPPREVYEIPAHNRIVDTTDAPFMPTKASAAQTAWAEGLVSRPVLFPEGLWNITAVKPRADKYGPFMVSTNARGSVEVYMKVPESVGKLYIGTFADTGYGIHSNTIHSKTFGCVVTKQEDLARLAKTLAEDKKDDPASSQTIWVNRSRRNQDR